MGNCLFSRNTHAFRLSSSRMCMMMFDVNNHRQLIRIHPSNNKACGENPLHFLPLPSKSYRKLTGVFFFYSSNFFFCFLRDKWDAGSNGWGKTGAFYTIPPQHFVYITPVLQCVHQHKLKIQCVHQLCLICYFLVLRGWAKTVDLYI